MEVLNFSTSFPPSRASECFTEPTHSTSVDCRMRADKRELFPKRLNGYTYIMPLCTKLAVAQADKMPTNLKAECAP